MLDWQTEEDRDWNKLPTPATAVSPWSRRFLWLLVVLLLGGGIWYAASFLQQQIETATGETEADLRHAYSLLRQAAERQDVDLFNLLLSGRDESWARAQESLIRNGQFLDRPTWGLSHRPELGADDPVTAITLSPDLLSAEVTAVEPYQFWSIADQQVKTARLQHTAVYRLGPDRWLYAPPEADFWGETLAVRSDTLHLTYPERDHEVIEQLFPNLSALMANTCRLPGLHCRAVRAEFVTDPVALAQGFSQAIINPEEPILLPTPTLLGLPRNADGFEFLWLAYGRYLSSVVITQQTRYTCCQNALVYQSLLHYQLAQLNLFDWPLSEAAVYNQFNQISRYEQTALGAAWRNTTLHGWLPFFEIDLATANRETDSPPTNVPAFPPIPFDLHAAYVLADYLLVGQNLMAADLQRALGSQSDLLDWYNSVSPIPAQSGDYLLLLLADYITTQRPDVAQPPGPLTITCTPAHPTVRLSYDPATRTWQQHGLPPLPAVLTKDGWPRPTPRQVHATPYPDVYLLETADAAYLATTDLLRPIGFAGGFPVNPGTLHITAAPNGRLLNLTWERPQRGRHIVHHYQLDLNDCDDQQCPAQRVPGQVFWSPNGRSTLISVSDGQGETPGLYFGDAQATRQIHLADHFDRLHPVWLNDEHFAYPTLTDEETTQFTIQSLTAGRSVAGQSLTNDSVATRQQLTITANDLTNLLPDERDPLRPIQPIQLIATATDPYQILLLAAKPWVSGQVGAGAAYEQYYLYWAELTADLTQIKLLPLQRLTGSTLLTGQINPQGNHAIIYTPMESMNRIISMLDLPVDDLLPDYPVWPFARNTVASPPTWSADGDWLAITYPFGLLLTNPPTFDLVHLAPHDLAHCFHSQWSR